MTLIVTSDLHFTSNPRDAYRWDLFPWLNKQVLKTGAKAVLLLGDLTDSKDRHPAELVNKLVSAIHDLAGRTRVIILRGNHDYIDINTPFFSFLNQTRNVDFITTPTEMELDDGTNEGGRTNRTCLFLPNTRDYEKDWKNISLKGVVYVFCHQTFDGALTENGTKLDGIPPSYFDAYPKCKIWSGDVHVAQRIGKQIEYVGAPYRIRFGDEFNPRVVLLKHGKSEDLHFRTTEKHLVVIRRVSSLETCNFPIGSQVKVRMELHRGDFPMWKEYKRAIVEYAEKEKYELFGPELVALPDDRTLNDDEDYSPIAGTYRKPSQILKAFAKGKELDKPLTMVGLELLKGL